MIKVSDYVVEFLLKKGISDLFMISGGGCIHLVDSVGKNPKMRFICNHHEQACAIAVEGYARAKNDVGACIVTTGPGSTNAITGVIGAWLDSIPAIFISGQVKKSTIRPFPELRQLGDQEINIIDIVKPITKYAVTVMNPEDIRYHMEKAYHLAIHGRPGPVWINIPFDVQKSMIDENKLKNFDLKECEIQFDLMKIKGQVEETLKLLQEAKRPVIIVGKGVRLAKAEKEFLNLVERLKIPVITSLTMFDIIDENHDLYYGRQGTIGQRRGNFIVQNSDLVLALGTRLNIRMISYNYENFAREAKKIVVDIDEAELRKPTLKIDIPVHVDVKLFMEFLLDELGAYEFPKKTEWLKYCDRIYQKYLPTTQDQFQEKDFVDVYAFFKKLSDGMVGGEILCLSNGFATIAPYQSFEVKSGQKIITNSGCASMGYGLPAAIGACIANDRKEVYCVEGDGSLQMNIQELQTIKHYNLPIKLIVINNGGYLSIKETQNSMFKGHHIACSPESGVSCPDLEKIAIAYGIEYMRISNNNELSISIQKLLSCKGPIICEILTDPKKGFCVKLSSYITKKGVLVSKPLEDMAPFLPREEFLENMIIKPLEEDG